MKSFHCFFHFCNPSVRLRKSPTLEVQRPKVQICNSVTLSCQSLSPQFPNHLSEGVLLAFYPLFPSVEFFWLLLPESNLTFLYERGPIYSEYVQRPGGPVLRRNQTQGYILFLPASVHLFIVSDWLFPRGQNHSNLKLLGHLFPVIPLAPQ